MDATAALAWSVTIALDTTGQLAFKAVASAGAGQSGFARWKWLAGQPILWLAIACYSVEFLAWTAFLSLVPLGRGVLLGSLNIAVIAIAGRLLFHERLSRMHVAGIALVGAGVAAVGLGT